MSALTGERLAAGTAGRPGDFFPLQQQLMA
jgi:hypothetical protein